MVSLLGAKMLFLIRLAWEASETQFASTGIVQSHLNCFYLSWARNSARLGSELVPVGLRIVVRLDSGLVSLLGSRANTRTRLDSTRSSARFAQDPDQLEVRLGSLFGVQVTATRESGSTWGSLGAGRTSSLLGSVELGAQFGAKLGIGWGLRDS